MSDENPIWKVIAALLIGAVVGWWIRAKHMARMNPNKLNVLPANRPLVVQLPKSNPLNLWLPVELDLSVARSDEALGVEMHEKKWSYFKVLSAPDTFYIKLNSPKERRILANTEVLLEKVEIEEVYVTNDAGSGTAVLLLGAHSD